MNFWAITDKGLIRKQNQDTYSSYCDEEKKIALFLVCDGMGGAKAGNIASAMASECFFSEVKKGLDGKPSVSRLTAVLQNAAALANRTVYEASQKCDDYAGMGTTLVAALVLDDLTLVLNVGDSRAYLVSGGKITQITRDHSVVEDLVERGDLTREESRWHPRKNLLTRALGTCEEVETDVFAPDVRPGDYILLCSDGLTNTVEDAEIRDEILHGGSIDGCCGRLLKIAMDRGAPDNITVVIFRK